MSTTPTQQFKPVHPFIPTATVFLLVVAVGVALALLFPAVTNGVGMFGTAVDGTSWAKSDTDGAFNFLIFSVFVAVAFPTAAVTCVGVDLRNKK